jgi:diguanylate cyclase (GGDEF)-like protein
VTIGGQAYRAAAFTAPGFGRGRLHITVLETRTGHPRLLIAIILASALLLTVLCALYMSRVFQLERQADEARDRESQLRRVGQAFASGLDRDALLRVVVEAAVEGVGAQGGRASMRPMPGAPLNEWVRSGDLDGLEDALATAEAQALSSARTAESSETGAYALADPLRGSHGALQTVAVARRTPFTAAERDLFRDLAAQVGVAMENVGLHETMQAQAITDELTGLANHRRFQEAIDDEAERARRFGQPVALIMLDIDDFKAVNDTYGHQQGDVVLAEVARVLRARSRDIDSPARYGGEEFALILPQTDLEGAYHLAERVREGIEALRVPRNGAPGAEPLAVTASLGVAALPETASEARELLARADAALYEAKRAGKNNTVRAGRL